MVTSCSEGARWSCISVRKTAGGQYRASATNPFSAVAEGTTHDEAVNRLRDDLEEGLRNGTTTVRLHIRETLPEPVWPDDEFTAAWLDGIRQARLAAENPIGPVGRRAGGTVTNNEQDFRRVPGLTVENWTQGGRTAVASPSTTDLVFTFSV